MARRAAMMLWDAVLMVAWCLHTMILSKVVHSANVTSSEFPAVYEFGDSVVDVGNAIAAFPSQFAYAEVNPNGVFWPAHSADRMCDGKLLIHFVSFGSSLGPTYPILRSTATNPQWGTNFAVVGATARNQTDLWVPDSGFNTPFSLNVQLQWLNRYKVRLDMYYQQTYVNQSLPAYESLNTSIYMVQAGFQDYFPLYDMKATTKSLLSNVPEVVSAISDLLKSQIHWPVNGAVEEMTPSGISVPLRPGGEVGEVGEVGALALPPGPGSVLPSARTTRDARLNTTVPDDPKTNNWNDELMNVDHAFYMPRRRVGLYSALLTSM